MFSVPLSVIKKWLVNDWSALVLREVMIQHLLVYGQTPRWLLLVWDRALLSKMEKEEYFYLFVIYRNKRAVNLKVCSCANLGLDLLIPVGPFQLTGQSLHWHGVRSSSIRNSYLVNCPWETSFCDVLHINTIYRNKSPPKILLISSINYSVGSFPSRWAGLSAQSLDATQIYFRRLSILPDFELSTLFLS